MANQINFDGLTVDQLYETFTEKEIHPSDAAVLVSSWIYENIGRTRRVFNFVESFPSVEPGCQPAPFNRTFHHADWVDGEDVVQAGQTTGELGFNERFHRIEADIDELAARIAKSFTCMAAMRLSLRRLLDEIRAEINRLHETTYDTRVSAPVNFDRIPNYMGVLDFGQYMGTTRFLDKNVSVWQTKNGTLVLPAVETMGVDVVIGPKLKNAAYFHRFVIETPEVRERFKEQVPLEELLELFGDVQVADGRTVRDVLKVLPAKSSYANLATMISEVGEREAAIVRTTMGAHSAISAALGIEGELETVTDADVAKLNAVPSRARTALTKAGINTVGELAKAEPDTIMRILDEQGVRAEIGDAAEWTAFANTLTNLR
ncbi:hypothetical protein GCM10027290_18490 [Micromonospora sonneratiae]|uniref:DUF4332 domain-containing protein n=1 Tax=Micromonospora sonneratiae TaxID=1184706 RepID=A0ABW3YAM3_9ACTN